MANVLHLRAYVPIPVGHTVELTCFTRPHLLGGPRPEWDELMVRDVDTGIVYQHPWHVTGSIATDLTRIEYPLEPAPSLPVAGTMRGRVEACRVISMASRGDVVLVTTLVVEPIA